jgi:hypothetical protein
MGDEFIATFHQSVYLSSICTKKQIKIRNILNKSIGILPEYDYQLFVASFASKGQLHSWRARRNFLLHSNPQCFKNNYV